MDYVYVKGEKWLCIERTELPDTLMVRYRFSNGPRTIDFALSPLSLTSEAQIRKRVVEMITEEIEQSDGKR